MEPHVSTAKFASMTASLLARKGDAAPSLAMLPVRPSAFASDRPPAPPPMPRHVDDTVRPAPATRPENGKDRSLATPHDEGPEKLRRIMVIVTTNEFEKLGIAAVKRDKSRHEIVRAALDAYFHQLAAELPRKCLCMADGPCCS